MGEGSQRGPPPIRMGEGGRLQESGMKQQLDPKVLVAVIAIGIIVIALIGWRVWSSPSVTPAPEVANAANATGGATGGGTHGSGLRGGGGPPPDALQKREEYNRAHPEAAGG